MVRKLKEHPAPPPPPPGKKKTTTKKTEFVNEPAARLSAPSCEQTALYCTFPAKPHCYCGEVKLSFFQDAWVPNTRKPICPDGQ